MSDFEITLIFGDEERTVTMPKSLEELKNVVANEFTLPGRSLFEFIYIDKTGEESIIEEDDNFNSIIKELRGLDDPKIKVNDIHPDNSGVRFTTVAKKQPKQASSNNMKDIKDKENESLNKDIKEIMEKKNQLLKQIEEIEKSNMISQSKIDLLKKNSISNEELNKRKEENENMRKKIEQQKMEIENGKSQIQLKEKDIQKLYEKKNVINGENTKYEKQLKEYENDMEEYRSKVESSKLKLMNKEIAKKEMLEKLKKDTEKKLIDEYKKKLDEEGQKIVSQSQMNNQKTAEESKKIELENLLDDNNEEGVFFSNIKVTHQGITCGVCNKENIVGIRYKCKDCNFNICEDCEEEYKNEGEHVHTFIKMRKEKKNQTIINNTMNYTLEQSNKDENQIEKFRKEYELGKDQYPDEQIQKALEDNNFDFAKTIEFMKNN